MPRGIPPHCSAILRVFLSCEMKEEGRRTARKRVPGSTILSGIGRCCDVLPLVLRRAFLGPFQPCGLESERVVWYEGGHSKTVARRCCRGISSPRYIGGVVVAVRDGAHTPFALPLAPSYCACIGVPYLALTHAIPDFAHSNVDASNPGYNPLA